MVSLLPHLGQAGLEHSAQCSSYYVYHHVPPFADQHWLDRCLQRDRVLGSRRHPRNVHDLDQRLHSASTQGAASALPVELRQDGHLHQHWCGGLALDGVDILLFPRCHSRHRRDNELECGHVRWHLSYWIGLLVRLGQEGVQAACLPYCARLVRIPPKKRTVRNLKPGGFLDHLSITPFRHAKRANKDTPPGLGGAFSFEDYHFF